MTRLTGTLLGDDDQSQTGRIHKRQIPKVKRDEFVGSLGVRQCLLRNRRGPQIQFAA